MDKLITLLVSLLSVISFAEPPVHFQPVFEHIEFDRPILVTHAGDGRDRLFVVEQSGKVKVFNNSPAVQHSEVFFDLNHSTDNPISTSGEEGLLGFAFDPSFSVNGYFYVYYSAKNPRRSVVSRFSTQTNNPDAADPSSEQVLLEISQPYSNHNGGMLLFGPDQMLYISTGDGGSAGDPKNLAQNLSSPLGKILRVDTLGRAANNNPFQNRPKADPRIWAYGLRNPWRMSFDQHTGELWAGDVGQNAWEEVNIIQRAGNYGWRLYEGRHPYKLDNSTHENLQPPVFEYSHREGQSITGGVVYRGAAYPALKGWYHFGDFVSGQMWMLDSDNPQASAVKTGVIANPSAFGTDEQGELYVVSYHGSIHRVSIAKP